eukprot:g2794.t1
MRIALGKKDLDTIRVIFNTKLKDYAYENEKRKKDETKVNHEKGRVAHHGISEHLAREIAYFQFVFQQSRVQYIVMTNNPFIQDERHAWYRHWQSYQGTNEENRKSFDIIDQYFHRAVRMDHPLAFDIQHIRETLITFKKKELTSFFFETNNNKDKESKPNCFGSGDKEVITVADLQMFLRKWIIKLNPENLIASTPADFYLPRIPDEGEDLEDNIEHGEITRLNELYKDPSKLSLDFLEKLGEFGKHQHGSHQHGSHQHGEHDADSDDHSCVSDTWVHRVRSSLLTHVVLPLCKEFNLGLVLKFGASRKINGDLCFCGGGDGVVSVPKQLDSLETLLKVFPDVRFLTTFLHRADQHRLTVMCQKFPNLHIYGCWWYLNNPSTIDEITRMRLELLGPGSFTIQHSDCRVLEQLVYKWEHSRQVIYPCLVSRYWALIKGEICEHPIAITDLNTNENSKSENDQEEEIVMWPMTRLDIRNDIQNLFGGNYKEYLKLC